MQRPGLLFGVKDRADMMMMTWAGTRASEFLSDVLRADRAPSCFLPFASGEKGRHDLCSSIHDNNNG
ncbi:unnamed protein product [Allacma fusca]|uniref:Uncharacterized protein n=1 Tax=Allacma fusca TaxID=39272 RepID=A0A8J2LBY3_9HEXA|nr:unnamed protein product [Allacma fusca]